MTDIKTTTTTTYIAAMRAEAQKRRSEADAESEQEQRQWLLNRAAFFDVCADDAQAKLTREQGISERSNGQARRR